MRGGTEEAMRATIGRAGLHLGWIAGATALAALALAAAAQPGYAHATQAIAVLGSAAAAHAGAFNAAQVVAGLALAGFAIALERSPSGVDGGRSARIACGLLLIAGVGYAAQGMFPFAPDDGDGPQSRRHAVAWTIAQLGWIAAAATFAAAWWRCHRRLALLSIAFAALAIAALAWPLQAWLPGWRDRPGHAQRIVLLLYFAWPALLALAALRERARR
jgi:hypothetical membrane protein